ncbi:hypothetical protein QLQ12_06625 [Actinoplanes sp. NEAU-A12]|uniref:DUF5666 domain-containing protein n=1 Tax=Actinoplanes sandaracinus TaxID=3045177 RepID=A0ABT6WEY7_9ACTN|nr:hypothetical protein [Actinoplanes sandaracinus]MDI6098275.1 hypothetical protein [Actinoplanes sandaracinus]
MIRRTVVPAALLLALTAGCANNTPTPVGAGGTPESATVSATASASAAAPAPKASAAAGETTLTGTVTAGVEPNCILLKDGAGDHLLIVQDEKLRSSLQVGAQVTVVGKAEPGMMTTCMQGEPFVVSSVAGS